MVEQIKENIWNIPNALTFSRLIFAFLTIYFIFANFHIIYPTIAFIIGMLTDFFDGQIARRFNLTTEFGRKFDMFADRVLMIGSALVVLIKFSTVGILTESSFWQIILTTTKEIIVLPFMLGLVIIGKGKIISQHHPSWSGKTTTFMQGVTFPMVLLGIFYKFFSFSLYFAITTSIIGLISAFYYINDAKKVMRKT